MSVREEEERKKSSTGRGLGLAAAALGVGVGAALYYMFSKRQDEQQGQGTSNEDWSYEQDRELAFEEKRSQQRQQFRERRWSLEECSICCDVMLKDQELVSLPCTHNFHSACITPWLIDHQTCPNCRKKA